MFLGWITFIKQKLLWPHKILVWNKSKDLVGKFLITLTWLYISLEIPTIKKHPVCQSFESFLLEVILRPWPSEFFTPDPVFAARTEIKVWQDYHLKKLLTQISISRGCKQFISSYIKETGMGITSVSLLLEGILLTPLRLMAFAQLFADLVGGW